MSGSFLLFSGPSPSLEVYRKELSRLGAEHDWVTTLSDIREQLSQAAYQGVLIDLSSRIKAKSSDREFAQELESYFPTTNIRLHPDTKEVICISPNWTKITFEEFIDIHIKLPPRMIRQFPRKEICLNVLLIHKGRERKVNTVDFSASGCFIWDSGELNPGEQVRLIIRGQEDRPIDGSVIWCRHWGKEHRPCGYSVKFSERQQEILKLL